MEKKIVHELKKKCPKEDIQRHNFLNNIQNANICVFVTQSQYWHKVIKKKGGLLYFFFLNKKGKRRRKHFYELLALIRNKISAIHNQEFEAAASYRHSELQLTQVIKERYFLKIIDIEHGFHKNGKVFLGNILIGKDSKNAKEK